MDEHSEAPLLQLRVRLEKPEIYACLMRGTRRAGRLRNGIQSALLLLVAVNCVAAFVLDEKKDPAPLGIAAAALLVLAGSGAAALLGLRQGRGAKRTKIKVPHR